MNTQIEAVIDQARKLSAEERVVLLDALCDMVSPPDTEWEAAWARECQERLAAHEQGETTAEDFDLVMERLRKEFIAR
jgi:putative addiction module component (TIGR02574 family)